MQAPELLGGPYLTPVCRKGDWLDDEIDGPREVGGLTTAPLPWPRRKHRGKASLILCGDLVAALHMESVEAICHYWGVGATKVWQWRQVLGIGRVTDGTRRLLQERAGVPEAAAAKGRERAASPESRAKMAISKTGKPAHPNTKAALLRGAKQPKGAEFGARASQNMLNGKAQKALQEIFVVGEQLKKRMDK